MKIPKIFHQIWLGQDELPEEFWYYRNTWIKHHPDWEFWFWRDNNLKPLIYQEIFDQSTEIVQKANILRIEVLNRYGGIYVDTDFECYRNIEPLIEDLEIFGCGEREGIIGNAFIGGIPEHQTWWKIMGNWERNIKINSEYPPTVKTGVVYMTRLLEKQDIHLFPSHYFFPTAPGTIMGRDLGDQFPESYAHHHWAASWLNPENRKKWNKFIKDDRTGLF